MMMMINYYYADGDNGHDGDDGSDGDDDDDGDDDCDGDVFWIFRWC